MVAKVNTLQDMKTYTYVKKNWIYNSELMYKWRFKFISPGVDYSLYNKVYTLQNSKYLYVWHRELRIQ